MSDEIEAIAPSAAPAVVEEQIATPSPEVETPEVVEVSTDEAQARTETDAPSGETESTEKAESEPKKNRVQERISELTRQREDAKQRADEAERRANRMEAQYSNNNQQPEAYPRLEDYDFDERAHQQAVIEYSGRQTEKAVASANVRQERMLAQEAQEQQMQVAVETFKERSDDFALTQADYYAKITAPTFIQSDSVKEAMFFGDNGPALAYYLASNPHESASINQLSPVMAGMKLAAIASKLSASPSAKTTNTPVPLKPITPNGKVEKDMNDMSMKEYAAHRRKGGK